MKTIEVSTMKGLSFHIQPPIIVLQLTLTPSSFEDAWSPVQLNKPMELCNIQNAELPLVWYVDDGNKFSLVCHFVFLSLFWVTTILVIRVIFMQNLSFTSCN